MPEDLFGGSGSSSSGESIFGSPPSSSASTPAATKTASTTHGGLSGLFHEAVGLVPNALFGAVHFTGQLGHDLIAPIFDPHAPALINSPTAKGLEGSFKRTGEDIIHPTHFPRAYAQGHLLSKLVEDLANASIVGGAVAKPLAGSAAAAEEASTAAQAAAEQGAKDAASAAEAEQAAREAAHGSADPTLNARVVQSSSARAAAESRAAELAQTATDAADRSAKIGSLAEHLQHVQKLTGTASNPIELAGKGIKAGASALTGGLAGIDEGALGRLPGATGVAAGASRLQGIGREVHEARLARGVLRQSRFEQTREATPIINAGIDRARLLANPEEEAASSLALLDERAKATVGPYQRLVDGGHADLADEYVQRQASAEGVAPEGLKLAYQTLDPNLHSPELDAARSRMEQAAEVYRTRQQPPAEASFLAQRGEPAPSVALGEYRRSQLGSAPVRGEDPAERALVENAPARFRPALQSGVKAAAVLDDMAAVLTRDGDRDSAALVAAAKADAITTLDQAVSAGLDPAFVQGGDLSVGAGGAPGLKLPKVKATGSRAFKSGEGTPVTVADQTRLMVARAKTIANNEAAGTLQRALGTTAVDAFGDEVRGVAPKELARMVRDEGLVAWDPANPFDSVPASQMKPETPLIPRHVYDVYKNRYKEFSPDSLPLALRAPVRANDLAVKGFKAGVLYLSPRWIVGHVIGHAILGTFGAGLAPGEFVKALVQAKRVLAGGDLSSLSDQQRSLLSEGTHAPGELVGRGQAAIDTKTQARLTPGEAPGGVHPIRWSQHAVAFTDDLDRVAIALAKAEKGLTPAEETAFRAEHPELDAGLTRQQVVNEYAIRESLKAQGDYTNLTNVEREVLGRMVLFYPWLKHMTMLTSRLAIHNPLRVAWALHLADLYGPKNQVPLTQGKVPLGNSWWLNLPKTDPFSHVFSNFGATGTGETPLAALNPAIDTLGAAFNLDVGKGQLLAHPPGFGPTDAYGRPSWGPVGVRNLADYVAGEQPQLSAATTIVPQLFGHEPIARYKTGEAVHLAGQDIPADPARLAPFAGGGSLSSLLALFGVPYATQIDEQAIAQRAAEKKAQLASQRQSYARLTP